ncbi:LuxR C-terminal-related transcriptional regulator [Streptomyces sp. NPDC090741]|uniref:helix-turn-helix transcriptional regulator n=1 Tax=Streptomyces sp. NPDC090741 TaxID=3365967 RepID=UPI00381811CC
MTTGSIRPLIGRGEELAAVRRRFAALGDGPALVGIAGDPGLGTTRLLAEIAAWAARAGAHVCSTNPEALPQALSALPALTAAPAVVIVDDVHRCGEAAREALTGLLETPRDGVLLVLGYRPRQCPPALLTALTAAHPGRHAEHLDLAPLDRAGAEEFAGAGLCARHRATLHQNSGGNPRLLALLAASCEGPGACPGEAPGDAPGARPFAARAAAPLLAEVAALGPHARLVAHAAAVLGEPAEPDALAEVAELDRAAVLAAVDELLAADVLRTCAVPGHVEFRHPLLARLVHSAVPGGWRLGAHRRARTHHRSHGRPAVRRARHAEQACRPGDESGATELVAAADEMLASAPATAGAWYTAAARLLPAAPAHRARRRELLAAAAAAAVRSGRSDLARAALATREELLDGREHAPGGADAAEPRARLAELAGDLPQAREIRHAALAELAAAPGGADPRRAAALWTALAATAGADRPAQAAAWADEAVRATAAHAADEALHTHALAARGTLHLAAGEASAALRDARAAARIADTLTDRALAPRLGALDCLARLETELEQYGPAVRHFTRGLDTARSTGQWPAATALAAGLAGLLLRQGRFPQAAARAEEAVRCSELAGGQEPRALALCVRAQVALEVHTPETAVAVARAACALAAADGAWWHRSRLVLAAAELAAGDALGALETLAGAELADPHSAPLPAAERLALAETLCGARLGVGRTDAAKTAADQARELAARTGLAGLRVQALLLAAALAESPAEALAPAEEALAAAAACGHAADEGWARVALARARLRLGEPQQADRHLTAAAYTATACSAARLGREVAAATAEAAVAAAPAEEAYMLSQREYEISQLVSQGCTNRQIARTLGVSHKTVETHLGRIFAKLEVSSRAEIANMIGRNTVVARPRARAKSLAGAS